MQTSLKSNTFFPRSLDAELVRQRIRELEVGKVGFYSVGLYPVEARVFTDFDEDSETDRAVSRTHVYDWDLDVDIEADVGPTRHIDFHFLVTLGTAQVRFKKRFDPLFSHQVAQLVIATFLFLHPVLRYR